MFSDNLRFLLLFGTYESIPPIEKNSIPSDDYYTSNSISHNLYESFTNVSTGRIPFNDSVKSQQYVDELKKYLFNSNPGSWKSKILLIWTKNHRFRLMLGYKITYGEYPYGAHWQIIPPKLPTFSDGWPLIDIQISW